LAYTALGVGVASISAYLAVSLIVEQTPEVQVPAVTGLTLSAGLDVLNAAELDLEVQGFVYSDEVPENFIVRQRPEAGRIVKAGRSVGVVLSRGAERHPTPDLRGTPLEDARILLEEAGLKPEVVLRLARGPRDEVLGQGIDPGRLLPREASVPLVVSEGPRPVLLRMPRLEGGTLEAALAGLDERGLRVERIEEVKLDDPERQGHVVSQEPLAGFPVPRGAGVILGVAGSAAAEPPSRALWLSRTLPPGFARHRVEVLVEGPGRTWVLADEWVGGGETFQRWVALRPGEAARLRIDGDAAAELSEVGAAGLLP
jgi:serine/threonine-protein kinase